MQQPQPVQPTLPLNLPPSPESSLLKLSQLDPGRPVRVLFLCMGNICRSPLAEGLFHQAVADAHLTSDFEIDSAGTHHYHVGEPPDARARAAAKRHGFEIDHLRARQVNAFDFEYYDLILMADAHNKALLMADCPPEHQHKLRYMTSFASAPYTNQEVPDPYYGGEDGFDHVVAMLKNATQALLVQVTSARNASAA
ncbi:MAG: low molecular weight protein-tyrosine-phosphatase [Vampirovibrionales bacterium]|nr:low molecular weight protein-tyrosine-phosphatase [Vampirovibrionales bacterium]